ncbi:hypothetical protein NDA16_000670 [Ustilago loliicola]|nr:hypothetical protein NDA16_000670 [Ustilago loliicola]
MDGVRPAVYNNGPSLLVTCSTQSDLHSIFKHLEPKGKLGSYRAVVKAQGLPFAPIFWLLKGLPSNQNPDRISADIQSYAVLNEKALGNWRVVYGICYAIPCISQFQPICTGNVLLVTDAETLKSGSKSPPAFQGIKPRRVQRPEFPL